MSTEISIECDETVSIERINAVCEYQKYVCECDFSLVVFEDEIKTEQKRNCESQTEPVPFRPKIKSAVSA